MTDRSPFFWTISLAVVGALAWPALPSCGNSPSGTGGFGDDTSSGSSGSSSSGGGDSAAGSSSGSSGSSGASSGSSGLFVIGFVVRVSRRGDVALRPDLRNALRSPIQDLLPARRRRSRRRLLSQWHSVSCGTDVGTFHCGGVTDCASGEVCCGVYDLTALTAGTVCQRPSCMLAQFCETNAECPNGVKCIAQSCMYGANVYLCGLKNGPPYNCVAR